MKKRCMLLYAIMMSTIVFAGCEQSEGDEYVIEQPAIDEEEENMDEEKKAREEERQKRRQLLDIIGGKRYLTDYYGFEESELDSYDCDAFVIHYIVEVREEPEEEVVKWIWEDSKEDYKLTDEYLIYRMLQKDSERKLTKEDRVVKIKMYSHVSNEPIHSVVADVESGVFYVDDTTPHEMDESTREILKDVPVQYDVESWESSYSNYDDSTASVGWEVRFLLDNGDVCVYSGGGASFSSFPSDIMGIVSCYNDFLESVGVDEE